jgi:hypothetical protein
MVGHGPPPFCASFRKLGKAYLFIKKDGLNVFKVQ